MPWLAVTGIVGHRLVNGKDDKNAMNMRDYAFRRTHQRKQYGAQIIFAHNDRPYNAIMSNISLGGAFLATPSVNQFSPGEIITLSIPFTCGQEHVKRQGRIKWMNDEGIAIEFL